MPSPDKEFQGGEYRVRVGPDDTVQTVEMRLIEQVARDAGMSPEKIEQLTSELNLSAAHQPLVSPASLEEYRRLGYMSAGINARKSPKLFARLRQLSGVASTTPEGVDLRVMKGEQPEDRQAYARAQEAVARTEPKPTEVIEDSRPSISARSPGIIERVRDYLPATPGLDSINTMEGPTTAIAEEALLSQVGVHIDPSRFRDEKERALAEQVGWIVRAALFAPGAVGMVGRAGSKALNALRSRRAAAAAPTEADVLAEVTAEVRRRTGVTPTIEKLADNSIKVTADYGSGKPVEFTIPPGSNSMKLPSLPAVVKTESGVFTHPDMGRVIAADSQAGVPAGQVRVFAESAPEVEHVVEAARLSAASALPLPYTRAAAAASSRFSRAAQVGMDIIK